MGGAFPDLAPSPTVCVWHNPPMTSPDSTAKLQTPRLVYGHAQHHDCLAFANADTAAEEAQEIVAIATARTWGEARSVTVRHTWNPTDPKLEHANAHSDDEPFDILEIEPVLDGDWPPMVTIRALTLVPRDIQARVGGELQMTVLENGNYWEIPLAAESELVAALRDCGYEVTRDDDLINTLDGRTFNPLAG